MFDVADAYGRAQSAVGAAKADVRYMTHRPDAWGSVPYRELWSTDQRRVDKPAAYEHLDRAAEAGAYVYRFVLSPDPRERAPTSR